eukprot:858685_1
MAFQDIHSSVKSRVPHGSDSSINKLIVFDWDDTLFPRTKILQMCNSDQQKVANISRCRISDVDYTRLNELSCSIHLVLSTFIGKYGARNIRILTASEKGWIKQSLSIVSNIGRFADVYNLLFDVKDHIE